MAGNARVRIESIDLVRGLIMLVMALDHVHDFFGDLASSPTDLSTTHVALFFTRWITNICAPVFFLLAGTGAYQALGRLSKKSLSRYLLTRGLWLIFLEIAVMRFALQFNVDYQVTIVTVLWALGWAMIALAGLIWLPLWAVGTIGAIMVTGHDLLDGGSANALGIWGPLWTVLHGPPGIVFNRGGVTIVIAYALIPWLGVTALGYVLGAVYRWPGGARRKFLFWSGTGLVAGFLLLRFANVYGDPFAWSVQKNAVWTLMSFLNTAKYPPSLLFLLMTLGPALLLLRAFDGGVPVLLRSAVIIGKVPLFFYILHFFLIHLLAVAASWLRYGRVDEMFRSPDLAHFPFSAPPGWDAGLPAVYGLWLLVLGIMFPLCAWYARLKQRRVDWWLRYL
jgi:uncharacterized membrane protein